jgi:drug/metabolite transporter (DMT)-like permease
MQSISRKQLVILVALTIVWGINWPIMKVGVMDFPPFSFRAISMWMGVPILAVTLLVMKVPFRVPREHWRELGVLTVFNMLAWQALAMIAIPALSSGRAAILGYTMPIFAAIFGAAFFGSRLVPRAWMGVAAAAVGAMLLLWHEFTNLAGSPAAVLLMLSGAAAWSIGTHLMRRTRVPMHTLTVTFWMLLLTSVALTLLAVVFERSRWHMPSLPAWGSIVYNGVMIFGFAQGAWFYLARSLPPVASSLSVMFIPVLGVFSGAWWLDEVLHWQDWTAVVLMAVAIASVLLPSRAAARNPQVVPAGAQVKD